MPDDAVLGYLSRLRGMTSDAVFLRHIEEVEGERRREMDRRDNPTADCEHWGHPEGEWKYSCCACSGVPNGCDRCQVDD